VTSVLMVVEASGGGVARHVADLSAGLQRRGTEVHICYSPLRMDSVFADRLEQCAALGVGMHPVPMPHGIGNPFRELQAVYGVVAILRSMPARTIVHGHSSKGGAYARLTGVLTTRRSVYTPNAFAFAGGGLEGAGAARYAALERLLAPMTDALIAVSESEAELARLHGLRPRSMVVVPNGIELEPWQSLSLPNRERTFHVGSVGRLSWQKDPHLWAAIVRLLVERGASSIMLEWAGDGEFRDAIAAAIAGLGVGHLAGFQRDIPGFMKRQHAFLMTSRYEGLPYALLEAMASARACVVRRCAGTTDLIEDGVTGVLVDGDNPRPYVEALLLLQSDRVLAERLGAAARRRIVDRFTVECMVTDTLEVYAGLT